MYGSDSYNPDVIKPKIESYIGQIAHSNRFSLLCRQTESAYQAKIATVDVIRSKDSTYLKYGYIVRSGILAIRIHVQPYY